MTTRTERETLLVFTDEDLITGGDARLYTFRRKLVDKALKAGGRIIEEHRRDGKAQAWDVAVPAALVRIGFKSRARSEQARARKALQNANVVGAPGTKTGISADSSEAIR